MSDTAYKAVSLLFMVALMIAIFTFVQRQFNELDRKLLLLEQNLTFVCEPHD